ncbi:MAG: hypothetical protein ACD_71C00195G0002 [uncultured bacterium (gcode 4)]|uniref:Uncharacterized protein n=1 Tax=uncultured bacterium (gcode 4) TaxID=1234023 RepID=K1ZIJ9_9BACT|nr:MAG: hypothetical protein ACD_71C00195G0002 [uncultured bacterium (gcode 4)]
MLEIKMKTSVAIPIIAWILSASSPSTGAIANGPDIIGSTVDNTKSRILYLVPEKKALPDFIVKEIEDARKVKDSEGVNTVPDRLLFPTQVQTIWIERMAKWFLWNMAHWWLDVINPPLVDIKWGSLVYCAGTVKWFFSFSKSPLDRTKEENTYALKEGIDAWTLPNELAKIWHTQRINLMGYFDANKIWNEDIVKDKEWYKNGLIETGDYLKKDWRAWDVLFIYFNLSDYKWVVRDYNAGQKKKDPNYAPHINTHQAIFLGNGFMEFTAQDIKIINEGTLSEMKWEMDALDYITNFIQQRWSYKSALKNTTKAVIKGNLPLYHSLIEMRVNWESINIGEELKKPEAERKKIKRNDTIKISGPVLMDWFHNANSPSKYISKNNHARTMFYFEFILIWKYTPSELMVSGDSLFERKSNENLDTRGLLDAIDVSNLYYMKRYENINVKLKEAILRFKFGKLELLKDTQEELDLINKIEDTKNRGLMAKLVSLQERKIDAIIATLTPKEKGEFEREYKNQIQWLQMMWYIQHEWMINKWTTNINAPIPYFVTKGLGDIFEKYVELRRQELNEQARQAVKNKDNGLYDDKVVKVFFYPTDNFTKVFNQLESELQRYVQRYPNFAKIKDMDLLKKNKFIDLVIDKLSDDKNIDVSNGKFPSMRSVVIPLDFVNSVLSSILSETYVEELPLSDVDSKIFRGVVGKNDQDYNFLSHIITKENYEIWLPWRKFLKKIWGWFGRTSSLWDFQLKIYNLNSKRSLIDWPSADDLKEAISYVESPELQKIIGRRLMRFERTEADLVMVNEIKKELDDVNDENRRVKWKKIYDLRKELFRLNDTRDINIIGKIIQTSLAKDKLHGHYDNLNSWLEESWLSSIEDIIYSEDLQKRYAKLLLVIYNRWEKTALIWTWESYILRILEVLWDDIRDEKYPKLQKTVVKDHIDYADDNNTAVAKEHYLFYKKRLPIIASDDTSMNEVKKELEKEIEDIVNSNFSATRIYALFGNTKIKTFLESQGYDSMLLPTLAEFNNTDFRGLIFAYEEPPLWRIPPQIYNLKLILAWGAVGAWWVLLWVATLVRRLLKRIRKNKPQEDKPQENRDGLKRFITQVLEKI